MDENFGKITIDSPSATGESVKIPASHSQMTPPVLTQPRRYGPSINAIPELTPEPGESYRMVPLGDVLRHVGFYYIQDIPTDEMAVLRSRLLRSGLRIGCYIPGKTTVMLDEPVPLYLEQYGELSTRGTALVALFMIAWMLSADPITKTEEMLVDDWIRSKDFSDSQYSAVPALATFNWLIGRKRVMSKARKRRISSFARFHRRRDAVVSFMLRLLSDPQVATPRRMERLATLYQLMGFDPATIHSDIHRLGSAALSATNKKSSTATIDNSRLRAMADDTHRAQQILSDVFGSEAENDSPDIAPADDKNNTLDGILKTLAEKPEWGRAEFEALCQGMTIGAMLERLNDLSFEALDEAVAEEDDDTIYIDQDVASQLIKDISN